MTLSDIEIYAQLVAVLGHVNERLGTTFKLKQLHGRDFTKMQLSNANGIVLLGSLEIMDNVCVGLLALCNEIKEG